MRCDVECRYIATCAYDMDNAAELCACYRLMRPGVLDRLERADRERVAKAKKQDIRKPIVERPKRVIVKKAEEPPGRKWRGKRPKPVVDENGNVYECLADASMAVFGTRRSGQRIGDACKNGTRAGGVRWRYA